MIFTLLASASSEADSGVFPPFDPTYMPSQLLWLAISFAFLYLIMSRIALPRLSAILEDRATRIAQDLDEAQRLKEEGDAAVAAYEQELADARKRAGKIAGDAKDRATTEANEERAKAEAEQEKRLAEAEEKISAIQTEALGEVDGIAEATTEAIVKALTGAKISKADIKTALK